MYSIQIHKVIRQITSFLKIVGIWQRGDVATNRELIIKWFYCIYYSLFMISLAIGGIISENAEEAIFLMEIAVILFVLLYKLCVLIWNQKKILLLLNRIGDFSIQFDESLIIVNDKIENFMKFVRVFLVSFLVALFCEVAVAPFLKSEKTLFFKIYFPLDWKHSEISFWIANVFLFTEVGLCIGSLLFAIIVWYLMLVCSLRYKILETEIRNMGRMKDGERAVACHTIFSKHLNTSVSGHLHLKKFTRALMKIRENDFTIKGPGIIVNTKFEAFLIATFFIRLINELGSFCSSLFVIQFGTGSLVICASVYCLAFNTTNNLIEQLIQAYILLYNISEIFMITYFGNEIMLSSNSLAYSLFESDWLDQPHSTKQCVTIFGEYLKRSHKLMVAKLYPLTLATFTEIVRSAYSMFNVLKKIKQ